jgi:hypothetical protein
MRLAESSCSEGFHASSIAKMPKAKAGAEPMAKTADKHVCYEEVRKVPKFFLFFFCIEVVLEKGSTRMNI